MEGCEAMMRRLFANAAIVVGSGLTALLLGEGVFPGQDIGLFLGIGVMLIVGGWLARR